MKEICKESEETKKIMCDGFFYKPKPVWDEFQEEQRLKSMQNLFENSDKNDNLESETDIKKKSPVTSMKKPVL